MPAAIYEIKRKDNFHFKDNSNIEFTLDNIPMHIQRKVVITCITIKLIDFMMEIMFVKVIWISIINSTYARI